MSKQMKLWQIVVTVVAFSSGILLLSRAVAKEDEKEESGEQAVLIGDTPAAVQAALKTELHGANATALTKESDDGFTIYEAEYEADKTKHSVTVTDGGTLLEREDEVASAALPAGVVAYIQKEFPKASIKEAQGVVSMYYEVVVDTGKKQHEVKVFANGQPVEEDEDE